MKVKVDPPPPFQLSFSAGEREKAKVVENSDFEGKEEEEEKLLVFENYARLLTI